MACSVTGAVSAPHGAREYRDDAAVAGLESGALPNYLTRNDTQICKQQAVLEQLRAKLPKGLVALDAASAQDRDALVVTAQTAKKYDLSTVADLAPVADQLTLGGPPETKTCYDGVPGLKQVYGTTFGNFRSLDAGGLLTQSALASGAIDVARMFTTQGVIQARHWVLLKDNKNLVSTQSIIPVARQAVVPSKIRGGLNAVSRQLTTDGLRATNKQVTVDKQDPSAVAAQWVKNHDL